MTTGTRRILSLAFATGLAGLAGSCATNPVSGKKQFVLMSEAQEIALGREADKDVVESIGLYPDEALQRYIQDLGAPLAAASERPQLPWTFRVVDDPSVNAFAIPGGFIYVTRGIMAHLNSEAELVAVLGHEIGHVTARHGVSQMSKQLAASAALTIATIASEKVARFGGLAQIGLGLIFLKYSRSDESQADALGFKYMLGGGYDPREMADVFRTLEGVTNEAGGGRLPQWLASHPHPENRETWATRAAASLDRDLSGLTVNRATYLQRLEGLMFGENPREGFFEGTLFRHPDLAFRIAFPPRWKTSNEKRAVGAVSPEEDALVVLELSSARTARAAAREFFSQEGVEQGEPWRRDIGGFPAVSSTFRVADEEGTLEGIVAFVEYNGKVYQLAGYASEATWSARSRVVSQSIGSFARETDPAALDVQPKRLSLVQLRQPATLDALVRAYPSTVSPAVVALINGFAPSGEVPAGEFFKRVVGGR
jgi:predicted Zn-dependent protease